MGNVVFHQLQRLLLLKSIRFPRVYVEAASVHEHKVVFS